MRRAMLITKAGGLGWATEAATQSTASTVPQIHRPNRGDERSSDRGADRGALDDVWPRVERQAKRKTNTREAP
jgi:hypothetical protein